MKILVSVVLYYFCFARNDEDFFLPSTLIEFREFTNKVLYSNFMFPSSTIMKILSQMMLLYSDVSPLIELYNIIDDTDKMENPHINIVGDLHGCFKSLDIIFTKSGLPSPSNPYVFLGDYVDRGKNSVELVMILCMYKLKFPKYVHLLMGNHESTNLLQLRYGTFEQLQKYSNPTELLEAFQCLFLLFPIAGTLFPVYLTESNSVLKKNISSGGIFLVHGGLPITYDFRTLNEFSLNIKTIRNFNSYGIFLVENTNILNEEKLEYYTRTSLNAINTFLSDENNVNTSLFSRVKRKRMKKSMVDMMSPGFLICFYNIYIFI
jgi:hypothetical protein